MKRDTRNSLRSREGGMLWSRGQRPLFLKMYKGNKSRLRKSRIQRAENRGLAIQGLYRRRSKEKRAWLIAKKSIGIPIPKTIFFTVQGTLLRFEKESLARSWRISSLRRAYLSRLLLFASS
ncbi:MAG: hypothetical protein KAV87_38655 [Desulfobacteraceae bacterium]|nr:hypothetical protein [Desulfobacteraceae bacterium]